MFSLILFLDTTELSIGWAIYTAVQYVGVMAVSVTVPLGRSSK